MSGGFVCACYATGAQNLLNSSNPDAPIGDLRNRNLARCVDGRWFSQAERLEIISLVAAVGFSECSAWIVPMLERDGIDQDSNMEE